MNIDTFLVANAEPLNKFQKKVIRLIFEPWTTVDEYAEAITLINKQAELVDAAGTSFKGKEMVLQPDHYSRLPLEPTYYNTMTEQNWLMGNVLKYLSRYTHKNGAQDLRKANRYLALEIRRLEDDPFWSKGPGQ